MIKMQVIGRLGKDCVVNTVNGKNVINFTVAHSEKYKDSQGVLQERLGGPALFLEFGEIGIFIAAETVHTDQQHIIQVHLL